MADITTRVKLNDGNEIPRCIFGTSKSATLTQSIHHALSVGYRGWDTAQEYGNESLLGFTLRSLPPPLSSIPRSELYVITKIQNVDRDPGLTIRQSVDVIGLGGYVDLFLIHKPVIGPEGRKEAWLALEKAQKEGLTRSIGVSNFSVKHLEEMKSYATVVPAVNQVELHPWNQEPELVSYCQNHGILLQAYAPVARGRKSEDEVLRAIAKESGKSWSKVLLRWSLQRGYIVTCKSDTPSRITDNVDIFDFELDASQMARLDALECGFRVTPNVMGAE